MKMKNQPTIVLKSMPRNTYEEYERSRDEEYIRERMFTDDMTREEALKFCNEQHATLLPKGMDTPDHYFYTLEDQSATVGYLWFCHKPVVRQIYLYHIYINEPFRRKGYARAALSALEKEAVKLKCKSVWLNVFGHNKSAQELYLSEGYQVSAMHLKKLV